MVEQQRDAYQQLSQLHRRLESAKDEERRMLSHELHDELGQTLTALKLRLQMLARDPSTTTRAAIDEAVGLVDGMVTRVRELALHLRPIMLDEIGLEAALRARVEEQGYLSGIAMRLEIDGLKQRLHPDLENTCFRIAQEAITNVVRHAGAKHASVRVHCNAERLKLSVSDDGRGMSPQDLAMQASGEKLGLVGMRERVRALGGELRLSSRAGTCVEIDLPVMLGA
jgi:signal transduction histidine kinase